MKMFTHMTTTAKDSEVDEHFQKVRDDYELVAVLPWKSHETDSDGRIVAISGYRFFWKKVD